MSFLDSYSCKHLLVIWANKNGWNLRCTFLSFMYAIPSKLGGPCCLHVPGNPIRFESCFSIIIIAHNWPFQNSSLSPKMLLHLILAKLVTYYFPESIPVQLHSCQHMAAWSSNTVTLLGLPRVRDLLHHWSDQDKLHRLYHHSSQVCSHTRDYPGVLLPHE